MRKEEGKKRETGIRRHSLGGHTRRKWSEWSVTQRNRREADMQETRGVQRPDQKAEKGRR